nr:MAG: hypothetical protein DIU62_08525 [Pseudomonadota bacterium]
MRARLSAVQAALAASQRWWHYFRRRELLRQRAAIEAEAASTEQELEEARAQLVKLEEAGGARYPGLSLDARRMLNLTIIAAAQVLALRITPHTLVRRMIEAMSRSEPLMEGTPEHAMASMQEIARARAALTGNPQGLATEARRLADHLAAHAQYRLPGETLPRDESVYHGLRSGLPRGQQMHWDLLGQDLWGVSGLFYNTEE